MNRGKYNFGFWPPNFKTLFYQRKSFTNSSQPFFNLYFAKFFLNKVNITGKN